MRLALPMALLLLNPLLVEADEVPRDHFHGIVLDEPIPTTFETGQALSLSGSVEDDGIASLRFTFVWRHPGGYVSDFVSDLELDYWAWVVEGRFVREVVFPHSVAGQFDLVVDAQEETEDLASLGRFDGLQVDRGTGPVMLPRRYFPLVHLDQPLPTDLATGEALHVAGTLEGTSTPAHILLQFGSEEESSWYFLFLVEETRFERTILLPREAEEASSLVLYLLPPEEDPVGTGGYSYLDIQGGVEPVEIPRLFFNGLLLDQPLPVQWPLHRPVVLAGEVRPFVRRIRLVLEPLDGGGRRRIRPGVEEGRFHSFVRLRADEIGPLRLTAVVELRDGNSWTAGEFVIEGVDTPVPDLEVGVLAVALLAGGQGRVPLFNRGEGRRRAGISPGGRPIRGRGVALGGGPRRGRRDRAELRRPGGRPGPADLDQRRSLPAPDLDRPLRTGAPGGGLRPGPSAGRRLGAHRVQSSIWGSRTWFSPSTRRRWRRFDPEEGLRYLPRRLGRPGQARRRPRGRTAATPSTTWRGSSSGPCPCGCGRRGAGRASRRRWGTRSGTAASFRFAAQGGVPSQSFKATSGGGQRARRGLRPG